MSHSERTHSPETKSKIAQALIAHEIAAGKAAIVNGEVVYVRTCASCQKTFHSHQRRTKTCSQPCWLKLREQSYDPVAQRKNGQRNMERLMSEGRWKGWSGRGEPSFPERYVRSLLDTHSSVPYQAERQEGRFSIDFAFPQSMLALEVDGKQHTYPGRPEHDQNRDAFLREKGWHVFRLKWYSVKTKSGKQRVHDQFQEFLSLLESKMNPA